MGGQEGEWLMQMCQPHWDLLRGEVIAQGIGDWIASSGAMAAAQLADQIKRDENTKVNYDPLMACHSMLMSRVAEGLGLMVFAADFGCPICYLNERRTPEGACACGEPDCPNKEPGCLPDFETWIVGPNSCVIAARNYMIEQGWIKET